MPIVMPSDSANALLRLCRRRVRVALDRLVDLYFGIDTVSGAMTLAEESGHFGDAKINGPVSYWLLYRYVGCNAFRPGDVFYDIGCGHGRVLCFAARQRLAKCIGVEISPAFAGRAVANARALRGRRTPIEVRVGDAAEMDYTDGTVFFLGDPFGAQTLRAVLQAIEHSLVSHPRRLRFIFFIPSYGDPRFEEVIRATTWLSYATQRKVWYSPFRAEFWEHSPAGHRLLSASVDSGGGCRPASMVQHDKGGGTGSGPFQLRPEARSRIDP